MAVVLSSGVAHADTWSNGHWVGGAIEAEWIAVGKNGLPITDELNANRNGKWQAFSNHNSIYWHQDFGAHQVGGLIRDRWEQMGWENGNNQGYLGFPLTREIPARQPGVLNKFEGGNIYYKSGAGAAHNVMGAILGKYGTLDYENGALGFPIGNESPIANNGRFNSFENGSIYWSPATQAQTVWGEIGRSWGENGWETGPYGYPTSDEYSWYGLPRQNYQGGNITFTPVTVPILPEDAVPGTPPIDVTLASPEEASSLTTSENEALSTTEETTTLENSVLPTTSSVVAPDGSLGSTTTTTTPSSSVAETSPSTTEVPIAPETPQDIEGEVLLPPTAGQLPARPDELGREPSTVGAEGANPYGLSPEQLEQARIFGGFCVFGTYGGPGGACRGGGTVEVMGCVAAIVAAAGSLYFPYAKALKIKRMLNDNGGALTVAKNFRLLQNDRKQSYAVETLKMGTLLAAEFLGFQTIADKC